MSDLKSNYRILPKHNLIVELHAGTVSLDAYIDFKKKLICDPQFEPGMNFLIQYSDATFTTTPQEIQNFVDFVSSNPHLNVKRSTAILTNSPNQVVATTLFKFMQKDKSRPVEIFSILDNALHWLKLNDLSSEEVAQILIDLQ